MNAKQRATWEELVQQCESRSYSSINVASKIRSDAIIAASALVELVTPELAALLERLASCSREYADVREPTDRLHPSRGYVMAYRRDAEEARATAAKIREALDDSQA